MNKAHHHRAWFDGSRRMTAGAGTRARIDTYELGLAVRAAIELEAESPNIVAITRLRKAQAMRAFELVAS